jgi:phosphoserine phosphatase
VRQEEISYVAENGGFIVDQSQEVFAVEASRIQLLQEKWNVKGDETMAFGDVGNDIEML